MALTIDPERLKQIRNARGLTQDELARKARLNKQTVYRLEKAPKPIRKGNLSRLAGALDVAPEVLTGEEPLPDGIDQPRARAMEGEYQLNVRVNGQIRNAFALAALHYKVPVRKIVELAPLLFVLAAEASLKRRRENLAELEVALDRTSDQWLRVSHFPASAAELKRQREVMEAERRSIAARDLFAEWEFGHELEHWDDLYEHDSAKENPLALYVKELAEDCDEVGIEGLGWSSDSVDYSVCWREALDWAGGDKWLAAAVQCGYVPIHEVFRNINVPDDLLRGEWTAEGRELRLERVRSMADRRKEEIDSRTGLGRSEWMDKFGVPHVPPKSQALYEAGGDEALAGKLIERTRSGRFWWREMPEELQQKELADERIEWLRRFAEANDGAAHGSLAHTGQEKSV